MSECVLQVRGVDQHTFLKSFKEQTPQRRLDMMPMISCTFMTAGVPRALKADAGCSVLCALSDQQTEQTM